MNSRRSYLDTLNAGRQRRQGASLDDITRTLDELEGQLDRQRDREPRFEDSRPEESRRPAPWETRSHPRSDDRPRHFDAQGSRRSMDALARDMERTRHDEEGVSAVGKIAGELKELREELRQQMSSGLRREFDGLRKEVQRAVQSAPSARRNDELGAEFDRLSSAVHALGERGDDRNLNMLRLEVEEVKSALDKLAREETVQSVGRRWDEFDRKWDRLESQVAGRSSAIHEDPGFQALGARLEQIGDAVNNLPESLSLRSLEEKVRMLSGAVEQISQQQVRFAPEALSTIDERLDEISRAIAASYAVAPAAEFDTEPFERIEARITALAEQLEELAREQPTGEMIARLGALSHRVEEIAAKAEMPDEAAERLAAQIAIISGKLDREPPAPDTDRIFEGLEHRFEALSDLLEKRQGDAMEQGHSLFRDLERRLEDVSERLDQRNNEPAVSPEVLGVLDQRFANLEARMAGERSAGVDEAVVERLESRLEDISQRLERTSEKAAGVDPDLIRGLESQVAALSEQIMSPGRSSPEFEDITPRLEHIESSLSETRAQLLEAARRAAEDAMRSINISPDDAADVSALAADLKSLEQLTRRSDERNAKTFEAIHDTLLKIVDRLGSIEMGDDNGSSREREPAAKLGIGTTPSLDPAEAEMEFAEPDSYETGARPRDYQDRSPAKAAADAASAALGRDLAPETVETHPVRSMLGGLGKAFAGRKSRVEVAQDEGGTDADRADPEMETALDPEYANQPLEPGSGAPDLNAIMRRVRDQRSESGGSDDPETAKSDFIAAARRAAQAAAAEADVKKRGTAPSGGKSGFKIGNLLRSKRKPMLMVATALVVALAGLQLGKAFFSDDDRRAQGEPAEVVAQSRSGTAMDKQQIAMDDAAEDDMPTARMVDDGTSPDTASPEMTSDEEQTVALAEPADVAQADITETDAAAPPREAEAGMPEPSPELSPDMQGASLADEASLSDETVAPVAEPAALPEIPADAGPVALREAAENGNPKAIFEIGSRYSEGRGVEANSAKAAEWYRRSAEYGFAPAQYRIGNFHEKGIGVERDLAKAKTWYQMAAEQGNASAMHNLAVLFAMGADGAADNESAGRWFSRAAELGVKDSQFNMGILTAKGVGMKQDLAESYKWFALVAETGDSDAAEKRDEVAKALRPEQLEKARAAAELWKAKPVDPDANVVDVPPEWTEGEARTASIDKKQAVGNIQTILNKNGYDAGPVDGMMGDKTRSAIIAFQKDNGFEPNGLVDETLIRALVEKK